MSYAELIQINLTAWAFLILVYALDNVRYGLLPKLLLIISVGVMVAIAHQGNPIEPLCRIL